MFIILQEILKKNNKKIVKNQNKENPFSKLLELNFK